MPQGKIRWYDKKKGYGFVDHEGKDIYIHYSALAEKFIPEDNDLISFKIVKGEKGLKAREITKVG